MRLRPFSWLDVSRSLSLPQLCLSKSTDGTEAPERSTLGLLAFS